MYLFPLSGWFDMEGKEVVGIRMFSMLKDSVGVLGLSGIDKLLCFMVVHRLQVTCQTLHRMVMCFGGCSIRRQQCGLQGHTTKHRRTTITFYD
jgi:WASH complex subunit strumpellin